MRFRAVISVTSDNRTALDDVCVQIKSLAAKAQSGVNYSFELREIESLAILHDVDISVEEVTIDGKGPHKNTMFAATSLGSVAGALKSFSEQVKTATKNDYVRLKACFQRFRELPAAKSLIPAYLPISQNHFNAIVEMNKTIFRTRCSYNVLMSIPEKYIVDGSAKRQEWHREFDRLLNDTKNQLNHICADEGRVNDYRSQFQRLHDKYRALCERYVFYRRLVSVHKAQIRGFSNTDDDHDGSISGGFKTYPHSAVVMKDYGKYADALHSDFQFIRSKKAFVAWTWTVNGDQYGTNWRYAWFETSWKDTNNSSGTDKAYPTVGSKKTHWYYENSDTFRRVEWYYKNKIIRMSPSDYPFTGLRD